MYYNLIIYDRNPWIYLDMVEMVQTMLKHKGHESQIAILWEFEDIAKFDMKNGQNIYFGHDIYDLYIKPGSILTEFDPVGFTSFPKYTLDVIESTTMSCYSKHAGEEFLKYFPKGKIVQFKYGYIDTYDTHHNFQKDIDVCFITNPLISYRRAKIINELNSKGIKVFTNKEYLLPNKRHEYYKRSKIILSIYGEESNLKYSSGSRIYPAVSIKGSFVIAEKCTDQEQHENLSKICINVPYGDMVNTIMYYLKYSELREKLSQKFYESVKTTFADFGVSV